MLPRFRRWLWTLLHRGTIFVAVKPVPAELPAAPHSPQRSDGILRLIAARFVH